MPTTRADWEILEETEAFSAKPFLSVTRQRVKTDKGQVIDDYYQVILPDFSICCALSARGEVITLWQYKHGARAHGLTFPAGVIEPGEDPEAAMRRELLEETGYQAGSARFIGRFACTSNQGAGWAHLFLLGDCEQLAEPCHNDLEEMDLRLMTPDEIDKALREGHVHGLPHLAVWAAARLLMMEEITGTGA